MTTTRPLVSVIIPTHNREDLLGRAIRSVLAQSYRELELIVVDDASTDGTREVVAAFDDPRLHYLRREQGGSAAAARNAGLAIAKGELIAFQDDDDIWLLEKLEKQVPHLLAQGEEVGLSVCSMIWLTGKREAQFVGGEAAFRTLDYRKGKTGDEGLIATPGWLVRRAALEAAGNFDPEMRSWDDWELGLRLWQVCKFTHLDEPLVVQDRTRGSLMIRNVQAFAGDMQTIMRKHGQMWAGQPVVLSRHYYFIGNCYCRFGGRADGIPWLRKAVQARPGNWQARLGLWAARLNCYPLAVSLLTALRRLARKLR